jgi:L-threonylcarbamoyladenylate synthase
VTKTIHTLEKSLQQGEVALVATDTVLGLLAPLTEEAFERLNSIKKRFEKPYLLLIADKSKVARFARMPLSGAAEKIVAHCWPGPITLIVPAREDLPYFLTSPQKTIALRVPDHTALRAVLHKVDGLFSTSANVAGAVVPQTLAEVDPWVLQESSVVVKDTNIAIADLPSTIIDCTSEVPVIVRQGAYAREQIEKKAGIKIG